MPILYVNEWPIDLEMILSNRERYVLFLILLIEVKTTCSASRPRVSYISNNGTGNEKPHKAQVAQYCTPLQVFYSPLMFRTDYCTRTSILGIYFSHRISHDML